MLGPSIIISIPEHVSDEVMLTLLKSKLAEYDWSNLESAMVELRSDVQKDHVGIVAIGEVTKQIPNGLAHRFLVSHRAQFDSPA